jgi:hypothetical protein
VLSAPFDERGGTVDGTRSRLGTRAVVGIALAGMSVVATVAASVLGSPDDAALTAPDTAVDLPTSSELAGRTERDAPGTRLGCEPVGCERWRSGAVAYRPVVVSDELAVHLGRSEVVGYDVEDGRELWRRPSPEDREVDPRSSALSDHGLAVVWGHAPVPALVEQPGVVSLYDAVDGTHRIDIDAGLEHMYELEWVHDRLVAVGLPTEAPHGDPVVVGISPNGEIVWRHEVRQPPLLLPEDAAVLLPREGVTLIDVADGQTRWQLPGRLASASEPGRELILLDPQTGVRVVDPATGRTLRTIAVGQAVQAEQLGPWIAVATPEEVRVHDRDSGEERFRRTLGTGTTPDGVDRPTRRMPFAGVEMGERVIVAWTSDLASSEIELATYSLGGRREQTMRVELPEPHLLGLQLHRGDAQSEIVHVVAHGPTGGSVTSVNLDTQEIVEHEGRRPLSTRDGLLVASGDPGLHVMGPGGEITVRHADQLASTDPLIVHGVGGILRLDRDMITSDGGP